MLVVSAPFLVRLVFNLYEQIKNPLLTKLETEDIVDLLQQTFAVTATFSQVIGMQKREPLCPIKKTIKKGSLLNKRTLLLKNFI